MIVTHLKYNIFMCRAFKVRQWHLVIGSNLFLCPAVFLSSIDKFGNPWVISVIGPGETVGPELRTGDLEWPKLPTMTEITEGWPNLCIHVPFYDFSRIIWII